MKISTPDAIQGAMIAIVIGVLAGLFWSLRADATPITEDPCKPVQTRRTYSPAKTKPSPIIQWITVGGKNVRVPGLRCTELVLDIPEPEMLGFDIDLPMPTLSIDDPAVLWALLGPIDTHYDYQWGGGAPKKRVRDVARHPHNVSEPPMWVLWILGIVMFVLWIRFEKRRRGQYLAQERRRKISIFEPRKPNGRPALFDQPIIEGSWDPASEAGKPIKPGCRYYTDSCFDKDCGCEKPPYDDVQ